MASVLSGRVNGFGDAGPRLRLNERPVAGTTEAADEFVCGADTAAARLNLISAEPAMVWLIWIQVCVLAVSQLQAAFHFLLMSRDIKQAALILDDRTMVRWTIQRTAFFTRLWKFFLMFDLEQHNGQRPCANYYVVEYWLRINITTSCKMLNGERFVLDWPGHN